MVEVDKEENSLFPEPSPGAGLGWGETGSLVWTCFSPGTLKKYP